MSERADCIFCRIVAGEIPAKIVRSDDHLVAFHDVAPAAPTHLLVVPRRHLAAISATSAADDALLGRLLGAAREIAAELGLAGFRVVVNDGESAGQSVFHLHVHLLAGRRLAWPPG
jgi:histidine triad (HIT) family protein